VDLQASGAGRRREAMSAGEKLADALTEANNEIFRAKDRRNALLEAWSERDWEWLRDAGYLTQADVDELTR
jgi:hypothetical protein